MNKTKKAISILLILAIILPFFPMGMIRAFADGEIIIEEIRIYKNFDREQNITKRGITIIGYNMQGAEVSIITGSGSIKLGNATSSTVQDFQINDFTVAANIQKLSIGNVLIDVNEGNMPSISPNEISPRSLLYGETLTIRGNNLDRVANDPDIRAKLDSNVGTNDITDKFGTDPREQVLSNITGSGMQSIIFERKTKEPYKLNGVIKGNTDISINFNYFDQFLIYNNIEVEGLQMTPKAGSIGTTVRFEAPVNPDDSKNLKDQEVFFMSKLDGSIKYSEDNKGQNRTKVVKETRNGRDYNVFTVAVPNIPVDEYFVVFTNPLNKNQNPEEHITQMMVLDEKFTVIQGGKNPNIEKVVDNYGPSSGKEVTITGQYLGTMNIDEFKPTQGTTPTYKVIGGNVLEIDYGAGTFGTGENLENVTAKRKLRIIIGSDAAFLLNDGNTNNPKVSFGESMDTIEVKTGTLGEDDNKPIKDVVAIIETIFTRDDGTEIVFPATAVLKNGFEYIPSRVQPEIVSITPSMIQVMEETTNNYKVPEGRQIAIHGKDLMIHKYIDENGIERVRYPKIQIGTLIIDKNTEPNIDLKILDSNGNVLDGTRGKELGTKLLFIMPDGKYITQLGSADVTVTNPTRNSPLIGSSVKKDNFVTFVVADEANTPVITEVRPNTSPVEGGEKVTIVGSNFQPGAKVYIDGEEVKNPLIQSDGRQIDIVTPKGREGKTQIQVMNSSGGMDVRPFIYIKAYSQPKINSFNPPEGEMGTPVVIKGTGFLLPDPMSSEEIPEKLIGSRVLLGDPKVKASDVNEYNIGPDGEIKFETFHPNLPLFSGTDKLIVADYSYGIVLEDQTGKKYIVERHPDGRTFITDRGLNKYTIELDNNGQLKANKEGGGVFDLIDNGNGLEFDNLELKYKTAYKFSGSEIIGQRARVIDSNTIYFYVPERPVRHYYDLTVINPDTKKDTKEGTNGFLYLKPTGLRPEIYSIDPSKGDVAGGYPIVIKGVNFSISEEDRSKVYIDGQLATITEMSTDGRSITVTVPKYTGDLREKETSELAVMVVVQNPGGRTAGREDLFSYIIPGSLPKINRIRPNQGSTAGEIVEIDGIGFLMQGYIEDANGNKILINLLDPKSTEEQIDDRAGKNESTNPPYYESPILPKVYFGNDTIGYKQGKILAFSGDNYLRVLAPANVGGKVDVYITNNDGGMSNKVAYTYVASKVSINSINPSQSRKQGGIKADIRGTGFQNSEINIFKSTTEKEKKTMPLVKFGNITNKDIPREKPNSGRVEGPIVTVKLDGGLEVEYNVKNRKLKVQIVEEGKTYTANLEYNEETAYVPVSLLQAEGQTYKGLELIKVSIEDRRLLVERGYAPNTVLKNDSHIELETPSYFEAKKDVPIYVINPDKAQAQFNKFNYTNPESEPEITNILRDNMEPKPGDDGKIRVLQVNYKGGRQITVLGKDFRKGAKITIEDFITIEAKDVEFISENELRFIMPELKDLTKLDALHKLRVENEDGGNAVSTDAVPPIYIQFTKGESDPSVDNIVPDRGPATGGTRVTIHGNDFRTEMDGFSGEFKVFFGSEQATSVVIKDYKTLEVIAPPSPNLGPVKVTIENPDGTLTQENLIFTYISKPKIDDINPKKLFTNDTETEVTIEGSQFLPGATVIVGGKIIPAKDIKPEMDVKGQGITAVDSEGKNIESAVVGGHAAVVKSVVDGEIKLTFPGAVDLENSSIIVINPDGGISEPYNDFKYEKPVPLKPMVLEAIPGYESTVMLIWNKSDPNLLNRATSYEIYGRKTKDKKDTFVGTTENAEYLIKGLEPNTEYIFLVRALNEHGAAIDFAEVKVKTLSTQEDYKQKEKEDKLKEELKNLSEKGKETIVGNKVTKTLGREDIKNGVGNIDFTLSKYKNVNEYIINIPLALARTDSTLNIKDGVINMSMNPKDMYTYKVSTMDIGDKDSNLQIIIKKGKETNIPRGKKVASNAYEIDFKFQRGKDIISIDKLLRGAKLTLQLDQIYGAAKNPTLTKLNPAKGIYEKTNSSIETFDKKGKYLLLSDR